jgi:hypothetical protein
MMTDEMISPEPRCPFCCARWWGFAAQRMMELEVESLTGAANGERSPNPINHRNGYRDRIW